MARSSLLRLVYKRWLMLLFFGFICVQLSAQNWEVVRTIDFSDPSFQVNFNFLPEFTASGYSLSDNYGATGMIGDKCAAKFYYQPTDFIAMKHYLEVGMTYRLKINAKSQSDNKRLDFKLGTIPGVYSQDIELGLEVSSVGPLLNSPGQDIITIPFTVGINGSYWLTAKHASAPGGFIYLDNYTLEKQVPLPTPTFTLTHQGYPTPLNNLTVTPGESTILCLTPSIEPTTYTFIDVLIAGPNAPHFGNFVEVLEFEADIIAEDCFVLTPSSNFSSSNYYFEFKKEDNEVVATLEVFVESNETNCESIAGPDIQICEGNGMAIGTGCLPSPHPVEGVDYCYSWQPQDGLTNLDGTPINEHSSMAEASPNETTIYTVFVTNSEGELVGQDDVLVEVESLSDLSLYPEMPSLCPGNSLILEAVTWGNSNIYTYQWSTGETTPMIEVDEPGMYSVTLTDPITTCTTSGSLTVSLASISVNVSSDVTEVCEGVTATLQATPSDGGNPEDYTYYWSNGLSGASIEVGEARYYDVTVTNTITGCQAINGIEILDVASQVAIYPENPIVCPGGKVKLKVEDQYDSYLWSTGATTQEVEVEESIILMNPVVSVTVTNADGCMAEASVEVSTDPTDPAAIKAYFEGKGFYAIDINIDGDFIETLRSTSDICDPNGTEGPVKDDAKKLISIDNVAINDLATSVENHLNYFAAQYGYLDSRAYITKNEDICACPNYLDFISGQFESAAPLTFWIHLFEGDEVGLSSGLDKLFILTNVPSTDTHFPGNMDENHAFLSTCLDLAKNDEGDGNTGSEALQTLFSSMDNSLDNFTDANPYNDLPGATEENGLADLPLCEGAYTQEMVAMSPAGIPMLIPDNFTTRFIPSSSSISVSSPPGALLGFTDFSAYAQNQIVRYYRGRLDKNPLPNNPPKFLGYHRVNHLVYVGENTYGEIFQSDDPFEEGNNFFVKIGLLNPPASIPPESIIMWDYSLSEDFTPPVYTNNGSGEVADNFTTGDSPILVYGIPISPISIPVNSSPIAEIDLLNTIVDPFYGGDGAIYTITHEDGTYTYILAVLVGPNQVEFFQWNCYTGVYEPTEIISEEEDIQQIASGLQLVTEQANPDEQNDPDQLGETHCFMINAAAAVDLFPNGFHPSFVQTGATTSIEDYIGMDLDTRSLYQSFVTQANSYGANIKFIVTGDDELCLEGGCDIDFAGAQYDFQNLGLSSEASHLPDALFRVHFMSDGRIGFCIRIAEDLFLHSDDPDVQATPMEERDEAAKELESLFYKTLQKSLFYSSTPSFLWEDPNGAGLEGETQRPNFFGKRPESTIEVNFISLTTEISSIGKNFVSNGFQLPKELWKADLSGSSLVPMFESPELLIGGANVAAEENPVVGAIQLATFAYAFVSEVQVRQSILETITHSGTAARAMYQDKVAIYQGEGEDGEEGIYHEAGRDGMSLIMAVLGGGALTKLKNLPREADPAARSLKDEIGDLKDHNNVDLDNLLNDNFYKYFNESNFSKAEIENYFKFIGEEFPNPVDHQKLMTQPSLAVLWKKAKDGDTDFCPLGFAGDAPVEMRSFVNPCDGVDLEAMIKKLPDPNSPSGSAFWQKYESVFIESNLNGDGTLDFAGTEKVDKFMKDLQDQGDEYLDGFEVNPERIKGWSIISDLSAEVRKKMLNVDVSTKLDDIVLDSNPSESNKLIKKIVTHLDSGMEKGTHISNKIVSGSFDDIDGYKKLLKNQSPPNRIHDTKHTMDTADKFNNEGYTNDRLEFEDDGNGYDVDVGVRSISGTPKFEIAIQLKSSKSPNAVKNKITPDRVSQIANAPAASKIYEVEMRDGTFDELEATNGFSNNLSQTKSVHPNVIIQVKNSEGIIKEY